MSGKSMTMGQQDTLTAELIWRALEDVKDPEIPVVSIVEMGIVRNVQIIEGEAGVQVVVKMTPTFSGCPALHTIRENIASRVRALGATSVEVESILFPPWTSDWISDTGRDKLKAFGLAPPARHGGRLAITFFEPVACPYCDSINTSVKNTFGSTLCRAIYYCNECRQPFEQFKPL